MDRESRREGFLRFVDADDATTFVARANGKLVGTLGVENHRGVGDIGMLVDRAWRGGGVGSALMGACVDWAREHNAHKLSLTVWPHNEAAIALYRKFGFEPEGLLRRHYRRKNGQLWDAIAMGLILDTESPGSPF
jgi:RimJ/RimL family protein N-acetyltransferase